MGKVNCMHSRDVTQSRFIVIVQMAYLFLALVLDLCIHIIDCIGDINVDLLKIFVWHSYFLYKPEDLFDGLLLRNKAINKEMKKLKFIPKNGPVSSIETHNFLKEI